MTTTDFTDAKGRLYLDGQEERRLHVVGWHHARGCLDDMPGALIMGQVMCGCDGKPLLGWTHQWPHVGGGAE